MLPLYIRAFVQYLTKLFGDRNLSNVNGDLQIVLKYAAHTRSYSGQEDQYNNANRGSFWSRLHGLHGLHDNGWYKPSISGVLSMHLSQIRRGQAAQEWDEHYVCSEWSRWFRLAITYERIRFQDCIVVKKDCKSNLEVRNKLQRVVIHSWANLDPVHSKNESISLELSLKSINNNCSGEWHERARPYWVEQTWSLINSTSFNLLQGD